MIRIRIIIVVIVIILIIVIIRIVIVIIVVIAIIMLVTLVTIVITNHVFVRVRTWQVPPMPVNALGALPVPVSSRASKAEECQLL